MYTAILFLPLFGFLSCGLLGCFASWTKAPFLPVVCMAAAAMLSFIGFYQIEEQTRTLTEFFTFINVGSLSATWGLYVDSLTRVMCAVVCGISFLVHLYSLGYMADDPSRSRFFSYLSLFTFAMLTLVTASNFLQLFFGWEGVGLASYLLIGFWFEKDSANRASIKAFVVNRVGDIGLILAIALIALTYHTVDLNTFLMHLSPQKPMFTLLGEPLTVLDIIGLLLFIGAMGKSAQFLLHVWLPDAMEGPTPVSALIHAATMVTAGVFLTARCHALYTLAPTAQGCILFFGATTAFIAATIALVQNDIKRVIAYSTCSQLGYMFIAIGVGAPQMAIFHLFTHAFFKALLFLGAGSIIHAVHHEQDMRQMGGLWRQLPFTWICMLIGTLSITGFPLTAGYYSKDAIIEAAYHGSQPWHMYGFMMALIGVFLTSFYSWRLIFMVFHGKNTTHSHDGVHEAPFTMALPVGLLALAALSSGFFFESSFIGHEQNTFWHSFFTLSPLSPEQTMPMFVSSLTPTLMVLGFSLAGLFYILRPTWPSRLAHTFQGLYNLCVNKWYIDAIYDAIFINAAFGFGRLGQMFDKQCLDAYGPDGSQRLVQSSSYRLSLWQTGYIHHYALAMLVGLFLFLTYAVIRG